MGFTQEIIMKSIQSLNSSVGPCGLAVMLAIGLQAFLSTTTHAADDSLSIVPQAVAGTAGFEPGIAVEWRSTQIGRFIIRPEVSLSEDERIGGGGAILYDLSSDLHLPAEHALSVGPRFVAHNSDDTGWEVDAMATYAIAFGDLTQKWRHSAGVLAAVGVREDRRDDENDIGASGGVFYSFRF